MNSDDVIRNINRKLKDDLISNDAPAPARMTLDDLLCAVIFVVTVAMLCLL